MIGVIQWLLFPRLYHAATSIVGVILEYGPRDIKKVWDNQNQFLLRLPRRLHLPSKPNQSNVSRVIQIRQAFIQIKSRNLYISRVTSNIPYISRVTESNHAPPKLLQSNHTSPEFTESDHAPPEWLKPNHLDISRVNTYKSRHPILCRHNHAPPE